MRFPTLYDFQPRTQQHNIIPAFEFSTLSVTSEENGRIVTMIHACPLLFSRAICFLKMNRFDEAKQDCDSALQLEPGSKKAFYRRALAHKGLQVPETHTLIEAEVFVRLFSHTFSYGFFFSRVACICVRTTCRPAATSRKSSS